MSGAGLLVLMDKWRWRWLLASAIAALACWSVTATAIADVYWANYGHNSVQEIGRATSDGSSVNQDFATTARPARPATGVAVDGRHVYWSNSGNDGTTIGRASLGGALDNDFITGIHPNGVAVDSQYICWTE